MKLKSEKEIIGNWKKNIDPLVSISCVTFNHENYIGDCLDSFLLQETDFPFEVLIHDDASTDATSKIINSYVEKYPNLRAHPFPLGNNNLHFCTKFKTVTSEVQLDTQLHDVIN